MMGAALKILRAAIAGFLLAFLVPGAWSWRDVVAVVAFILILNLTDAIAEATAKKATDDLRTKVVRVLESLTPRWSR